MALKKAVTASGIKWAEIKGSLLLIEPLSVEDSIKTAYGDASAVKANVIVLDGDQAGTTYSETLIFPKLLQSAVKGAIGDQVIGRLSQGVAKPGQSAPWTLEDASTDAAAVELATPYLITEDEEDRPF